MYGYIYKTTNLITNEIYIGKKALPKFRPTYHGAGRKIKEDIEKYGKENFYTELLYEANNSDELNALEVETIQRYKDQYGDMCINEANGGDGGDVTKYWSEERKSEFVKTMTDINRERCQTEEFRRKTGERMREKYEDPEEREKHSQRVREAWSDPELLERHSKMLKEYFKNHPMDHSYACKPCAMELNGQILKFNSREELKDYLKSEYGVVFSNPGFKKIFESGEPYKPFHKNKENLIKLTGMRLYDIEKV